jgi:hypothetical protein
MIGVRMSEHDEFKCGMWSGGRLAGAFEKAFEK